MKGEKAMNHFDITHSDEINDFIDGIKNGMYVPNNIVREMRGNGDLDRIKAEFGND